MNLAAVNGYIWRTMWPAGAGEFLVGLDREVRDGAGVRAGGEADVTIELDQAPRGPGALGAGGGPGR